MQSSKSAPDASLEWERRRGRTGRAEALSSARGGSALLQRGQAKLRATYKSISKIQHLNLGILLGAVRQHNAASRLERPKHLSRIFSGYDDSPGNVRGQDADQLRFTL